MFLKKQMIFTFGIIVGCSLSQAKVNNEVLTSDIIKSTESILRLSKGALETMSYNLSSDQKQALRKIAFRRESDLQIRWRALVLSSRLLGREAKGDILLAAKSTDWFMRAAAMNAAKELSKEEAINLARRLVGDKALVVRSAAAEILGESGETSDRQILWSIIRDPINLRKGQSLWIRSQTLQILAKKPQKTEAVHFIDLLKENDLELQAISIQALESISEVKFGTSSETIEEHKKRWLQWWEKSKETKTIL